MPTYEYRCPEGHDFEKFFSRISEAAAELECPECGKIAERRISGGAGLLFKGSGFYLTDYGRNAHRKSAPDKESGSKESGTKESKSESKSGTGGEGGGGSGGMKASEGGGSGSSGSSPEKSSGSSQPKSGGTGSSSQ